VPFFWEGTVSAVANTTAYLSFLYGHNSFELWSCKGYVTLRAYGSAEILELGYYDMSSDLFLDPDSKYISRVVEKIAEKFELE
jgi:hypothetical protein